VIDGSVIDDNNFQIAISLRGDGKQGLLKRIRGVERRDNNRNERGICHL